MLNEVHPLDKPYDTLANIFNENKYSEKKILKIIEEFGPISIRKENGEWFVYRFNDSFVYTGTRFKLFRVPLDNIYNKDKQIINTYFYVNPFGDEENPLLIDYTHIINNVYIAEGDNYNSINHEYNNYKLENIINVENFGFEMNENDTIKIIKGSAIAFNTTKNNIYNLELKISIFDKFIDGKLITEDIVKVKDTLKIGQLKIIEIRYTPKKKFKSSGITPANIEIIDFEKF